MSNLAAGALDRRIRIEMATETRDTAGDVIRTDWTAPPGWANGGKRWARKIGVRLGGDTLLRGVEVAGQAQQVLREHDTIFILRYDSKSVTIAPETYRVVHHERVFLIVAIGDTNEREDGVILLCASRPDLRGSSAPVSESGQS